MAEFRMPSLGADMTEGTIVAWNRKPGEAVKRGDIVAVVGTEKAITMVEASAKEVPEAEMVRALEVAHEAIVGEAQPQYLASLGSPLGHRRCIVGREGGTFRSPCPFLIEALENLGQLGVFPVLESLQGGGSLRIQILGRGYRQQTRQEETADRSDRRAQRSRKNSM